MPPATVFIFGNPKNGTPLMLAAPTLALELPLRMLAWEDGNGMAFVSYIDPRSFAEPYALAGYFGTLQAMADLLDAIAQDAADGIGGRQTKQSGGEQSLPAPLLVPIVDELVLADRLEF